MNQEEKNYLLDLVMRVLPGAIFAVVGYLWTAEAAKRDKTHELFAERLKAEFDARVEADRAIIEEIRGIDSRLDQHDIELAVIRATQPQGQ